MFQPNIKNITYNKDFDVLIIKDVFDKKTNKAILNEMIKNSPNYEEGRTGTDESANKIKRSNLSCFYDIVYANKRKKSVLLKELDLLFSDGDFTSIMLSTNKYPFVLFPTTNLHETQVSRYGNSNNFFGYHIDSFGYRTRLITVVYYAHNEPKKYKGGEIVFSNDLLTNKQELVTNKNNTDLNNQLVIEPENNMLVVFSSFKPHCVLKTTSPKTFKDGRFSANIWIGIQ